MIATAKRWIRASLDSIEKLMGSSVNGYEAAKVSILNKLFANQNENAIPASTLDNLSSNAFDLWRNNPNARKIVRQLQTKVIGTGMRPIPQAVDGDGKPFGDFRKKCQTVWQRFIERSDIRGLPGQGGDHFTDQAKTALASVIRQGNSLNRLRTLSRQQMQRRGGVVPLACQLIDADRLDESLDSYGNNAVWKGVEVSEATGEVVAYHLRDYHRADWRNHSTDSKRVPVNQIGHVFVTDDVDQCVGVSWFAPVLDPARDVSDYTYNELKAAVMASCVVMGIKGMQTPNIGMQKTNGGTTDTDGNTISRLRPGMIVNLGQSGALEMFDPKRPNTDATEFVQQLLRQVATGVPGVKGSALTGDFRRSSFASEKSADNELWPEIEALQQWWSCSFYQPIYTAVIEMAIAFGEFDGIITEVEYRRRKHELIACHWQGPVQKSINEKDDRMASRLACRNGQSVTQIEAAKVGRDAYELLQLNQDYFDYIDSLTVDDEYKRLMKLAALGIDFTPSVTVDGANSDSSNDPETAENRMLEVLEAYS